MGRSRSLIVLGMALTLFTFDAAVAAVGAPKTSGTETTVASWSAPVSFLPRQGDLRSVSCPSLAFCGAFDVHGGFFVKSHQDWLRREQLATRLTLISCVSSMFCVGMSYNGRASFFDGTSWSPAETIDARHEVSGLSCVSTSFCLAVDTRGRSVTYQDGDWEVAPIGDSVLNDVSCVSGPFCMAVGGAGEVWQYDGATWTETRDVAPDGGAGISCASTTLCAIVDNLHGVETFDGTSWSPHQQIDDATFLTDVSCVSSFCLATDERGRGFSYDEGMWDYASSLLVPMKSISCPRPWRCVAVGPTGDAASFATTWHDPKPIDPEAGYPASVSCPNGRFCMVVDDFGTSVAFRAGSWGVAKDHSNYGFGTISCPSSVVCVALNEIGYALSYERREWSEQVSIALSADLSCTRILCMAVGGHPFTSRFDGSTWTMVPIDSPRGLVSISCPAGELCVGLRANGEVHTYDGESWSSDGSVVVPHGQISCASESFCMAIGRPGAYSVFDGSAWSAPASSGGTDVTSLSCAEDDSCMAMTSTNRALRYSDGDWTSSDILDPSGGGFTSVSCWATDSCRAVTRSGDVLTYE